MDISPIVIFYFKRKPPVLSRRSIPDPPFPFESVVALELGNCSKNAPKTHFKLKFCKLACFERIIDLSKTSHTNSQMPLDKEENVYMAKLCEAAERFEDMFGYMKEVVSCCEGQLSIEERNLLSITFQCNFGSRKNAWRALSSMESKEESNGSKYFPLLKAYKAKVEGELIGFCEEGLNLLDTKLIPASKETPEAHVFYQKMKGDYCRSIAEYNQTETRKKAIERALCAYKAGADVASASLFATDPLRLGLALSFSSFYYEMLNDQAKAYQLAKTAFDDGIAGIESQETYQDAITIMQLLRENLALWSPKPDEEEKTTH